MSASEKLKALEAPARPYWDEDSKAQEHIIAANRCVDALVDTLSQIVAVARAAEEAKSALDYIAQAQRFRPDQDLGKYATLYAGLLAEALSALESALGEEQQVPDRILGVDLT